MLLLLWDDVSRACGGMWDMPLWVLGGLIVKLHLTKLYLDFIYQFFIITLEKQNYVDIKNQITLTKNEKSKVQT